MSGFHSPSHMSFFLAYIYILVMSPSRAGSAWLVTFFTSARNRKLAENELKFDSQLKNYFCFAAKVKLF